MRVLISDHAEDMGGFTVEPYAEFDPDDADPETLKRLEDEGKIGDAELKASKSKKGDS